MALRLARSAFVASRMNAARSLLPVRGGGGGPLPPPVAPSEPLPEQDEMTWDDGTGNPEHCLDWQKNTGGMTPGTAATMLVGAFAGLYLMSKAVVYADPEGRRPFAPKQLLYDENKLFFPGRNQ